MGIEKPISVGHFTFDAELANMDHVRLHQGIPDGGESLLGDELHEVVTLQVDEAVTPSQVNTPNVDPVHEKMGVIRQVPQMQGKMNIGVESVRYVENDPLAGFLGRLARSLGNSRWHGKHPVVEQDRRSVAVACIPQHYRITVSLDQRGRGFNHKTENVMARLVLVQ